MAGKSIKTRVKKLAVSLGYYSKPDFLIIGAQKTGTSSLYEILKKHSQLTASLEKELHYFSRDEWYLKKNSLNEYHNFFLLPYRVPAQNLVFEVTPIYLYHPKTAKRIHDYNADLKLIVVLRDPAYRALSAWTMYHHHFKDTKKLSLYDARSFKDAIEQELLTIENSDFYSDAIGYVKRGLYVYQLERFFQYFNREQILILENNQLKNQFQETLERIFLFLDIPSQPLRSQVINKSRVNNKTLYTDEIQMLKEFYRPHNERLFDLLGEQYDWNN